MREHCTALRTPNTVRVRVTGENPVTDRSGRELKTPTAIIDYYATNDALNLYISVPLYPPLVTADGGLCWKLNLLHSDATAQQRSGLLKMILNFHQWLSDRRRPLLIVNSCKIVPSGDNAKTIISSQGLGSWMMRSNFYHLLSIWIITVSLPYWLAKLIGLDTFPIKIEIVLVVDWDSGFNAWHGCERFIRNMQLLVLQNREPFLS
jgi:hypothetical protein